MFLMDKIQVEKEMNVINTYLSKCLWMDFEFSMMGVVEIVISGTIDTSINEYAIDIHFEQPHFVSSLFMWQLDTSKPFIQLVDEDEFLLLNSKYRTIVGDYIFKIGAENYDESPIFIAAKKINCTILKDEPF